jgi:hypothetical protein
MSNQMMKHLRTEPGDDAGKLRGVEHTGQSIVGAAGVFRHGPPMIRVSAGHEQS